MEAIDNSDMITIAVNSKENFQNLKIKILLKTIEI